MGQTTAWKRNKNKKDAKKQGTKTPSNQRLWDLMEMPGFKEEGRRDVQEGPWGLGDRRTLDQFIEFTGVSCSSTLLFGYLFYRELLDISRCAIAVGRSCAIYPCQSEWRM